MFQDYAKIVATPYGPMDVPEFYEWRDDIDVVPEVGFMSLCEEIVENRDAPDSMQRKFGWLVAILRIRRWPDSCPCHGDVRYCNFSQVVISTVVYCSGENPAVNIEGNTHDH